MDVKFGEILFFAIENFMSIIEDRGLTIVINNNVKEEGNEIEKGILKADAYQLRTMIENLLGNAVKYAESCIRVELSRSGNEIMFVVVDDGPGIDDSYHEKIFEEYFQVPGSKKGTGLGLFSVKRVVENHNGRITINSSPGRGTIFAVVLPVVLP